MVIDLIGVSQPRELQHKEDLVWGGGIVTRYVIPLIPWPLTSFGVMSLTFAGGRCVFPLPSCLHHSGRYQWSPEKMMSFRQRSGVLNCPVAHRSLRESTALICGV